MDFLGKIARTHNNGTKSLTFTIKWNRQFNPLTTAIFYTHPISLGSPLTPITYVHF